MVKTKRLEFIDNLRGLAMLAMFIIHSTAYFLKDRFAYFIWDFFEWAVPIFVFCSFYLLFEKISSKEKINWILYFKKRLSRLLFPYFIFLIFYFLLLYFFEPKKFNFDYLLANIFLYGGADFNWLVLLFVYFTFLTPIFHFVFQNKTLKIIYFCLVIFSSIFFIFYKVNYRIFIWLTWSFYLFLIPMFLDKDKRKIILMTIISLIFFFLLRLVEIKINHNLSQYANKYPPNLYHLLYGSFFIGLFYFLFNKVNPFFGKILKFFSENSYSLYFIHFLVLLMIVWLKILPKFWHLFFLEILFFSILIQLLLNTIKNFFFKR